jgi:thiamine kinase-like enzyme
MVPVAEAYAHNHPLLLDRLAAMPHTLVHFDFRADNLFFDADGSVVVIDWQSISVGGGAADVGYFLGQNLSTEDRRAHEDRLLRAYHDTLLANGVDDYAYDRFFDDYRLGVMYGWVIPVFAVGSLDVSSERAMALWSAVISRVQDAIFDHGADEFIER